MKQFAFIFGILPFFLFSCATTNPRIASKENFKKDYITKEDVPIIQYIFSSSSSNLLLQRVHLSSVTIEEGAVYKEISDSCFILNNGTFGILKYIYRDGSGVDNFYVGFHNGFFPLPFNANNKLKEFSLFVEGSIKTTSGRKLPAVFLRDSEGVIKEVWAVINFPPGNRLTYQVGKKKKQVNIVAEGETIKKKNDY